MGLHARVRGMRKIDGFDQLAYYPTALTSGRLSHDSLQSLHVRNINHIAAFASVKAQWLKG